MSEYMNYLVKRLERENRKIEISKGRRDRFINKVMKMYNEQGLRVYEVPYQLTTFERTDVSRPLNDPDAHYFIAVDANGNQKEQRCLYWDSTYEFVEVNYLILALQNLASIAEQTL